MKNAILKVTNSAELIILSDDNIVSVMSLDVNDILTDTYNILCKLEIQTLKVVLMCSVINSLDNSYKISREIEVDKSRKRYLAFAKGDLKRIENLAVNLNVSKVEVYDFLMGLVPLNNGSGFAVCAEGQLNSYNYITVNEEGGIVNYLTTPTFSTPIGLRFTDMYKTPIKNYYNLDVKDSICGKFKNFNLLKEEVQRVISIPIYITESMKPIVEYNFSNEIEPVLEEEPRKEEEQVFYESATPSDIVKDLEEKEEVEEKKLEADDNTEPSENEIFESAPKKKVKKHRGISLILSAACIGVSMFAGGIIALNELGPQTLSYINQRGSEVYSQSQPQAQTIKYYQDYVKGLESGKNIDSNILDNIYNIKFDGVLSEIHLNQTNVGVLVFLKNAGDINNLKNQYNNIFRVTSVQQDGQVTLGKTTLTKYTIIGELKG